MECAPCAPCSAEKTWWEVLCDDAELPLHVVATSARTVRASYRLPPDARSSSSSPIQRLRYELERLAERPPKGLEHLALGSSPTQMLDVDDRVVDAPPHGPPWAVLATISVPEACPYHSSDGVRLRLLVDAAHPLTPPEVHFEQVLPHFLIDDEGGMPSLFYQLLANKAVECTRAMALIATQGDVTAAAAAARRQPRFSLRSAIVLARRALLAPLHPCANCSAAYASLGSYQRERFASMAAYARQCSHPELFSVPRTAEFPHEWLAPPLREVLNRHVHGGEANRHALSKLLAQPAPGVFVFPLFTLAFCDMLLAELDAYDASGLPTTRPNSMNRYGLILNDIGLEPLIDSLVATVFRHIGRVCFPIEGGSLDRHHTFIVRYSADKDAGLDMHTDNSEVTFNVCLGRDFRAAGLTFCGEMGAPEHRHFSHRHEHSVGNCVVHLGRRRHGADDITEGERVNLIVWCHNRAYRASSAYLDLQQQRTFSREDGPPDPVCLSYTHDRDYYDFGGESRAAHAHMTRRAWVPPPFAKHDATGSERRVRRRSTGAEGTDLRELRDVMGRVADGLVQRDEMGTAAEQHVDDDSAMEDEQGSEMDE